MRDHAARGLAVAERPYRIAGATELEGAGALQVLAFEEQLGTGERVERARTHDGRAVRMRRDARRGGFDGREIGIGEGHGVVTAAGARVSRDSPSWASPGGDAKAESGKIWNT